MSSRGIDVSNNNGSLDWQQIAASGIEFAIAKVTEGTSFIDRFFPGNWAGMKANGLVRGAYHFARPSVNPDPIEEANYFLDTVYASGGLEYGDLVVLDLEDPDASGNLADWALGWLQYVHSQVGYRPVLYSGRFYLQDHGCAIASIAEYPLWLAAYQTDMPANMPPWSTYLLWQFTDAATVPGVRAHVDEDTVYDLNELRAYGKPGPVPPAQPDGTVQSGPFAGLTLPELQAKAEGLLSATAYLGDTMADGMTALAKEAQRVRVEQVGARP